MAYTFSATSGDTRSQLAERVVFNSFSSTRYTEFVKRALNDAVGAICRKVGFLEAYEVLAYDSSGIVTQSVKPWFRVDEVWKATATGASTGEKNFMNAADYPLQRLDDHVLGDMTAGSGPVYYIVRRATSPTGFVPQLDLRIVPPGTGGYVAIRGLQRPTVMDSDDDVTGLGAEFDGAVVAYAKAACFDNEDDFEAAGVWRLRFDAELRQILEGGVDNDGPDVVDGMWDS
jgi:hypothetical protein